MEKQYTLTVNQSDIPIISLLKKVQMTVEQSQPVINLLGRLGEQIEAQDKDNKKPEPTK